MGRGQPGDNHGKLGDTRSTLKPRPPKHVFNLVEMPDDIRKRLASDNAIYLDIETTGLSKQYHDITTVVVLDKDGRLHVDYM